MPRAPQASTCPRPRAAWSETGITYANAPGVDTPIGSMRNITTGAWSGKLDVSQAIPGDGTYTFAVTTTRAANQQMASRESSATSGKLVIDPAATATPTSSPTGDDDRDAHVEPDRDDDRDAHVEPDRDDDRDAHVEPDGHRDSRTHRIARHHDDVRGQRRCDRARRPADVERGRRLHAVRPGRFQHRPHPSGGLRQGDGCRAERDGHLGSPGDVQLVDLHRRFRRGQHGQRLDGVRRHLGQRTSHGRHGRNRRDRSP